MVGFPCTKNEERTALRPGRDLRPMGVTFCYFIQSHRDPEQIYRLLRTLRRGSPGAPIVLQHNPAHCALDEGPLSALGNVHFLRLRERQVRANYNCQVQPFLDAIGLLEGAGVSYDWFVSLTAQCYPVQPLPAFEAHLEASGADGFLRYWDVLGPESPWSQRKPKARYWHRYLRLPEGAEPWLRALRPLTKILPLHFYLDYGPLVGRRTWSTPFRNGFRCLGGWAWFSLRRQAVLYLRDFLAEHPEVVEHYKRTVTPEESIVQTVLVNSGKFRLVNDDLRLIDYEKAHKGSPRTMTSADLPLLASGKYYFARKFDLGVDAGVLDRIDAELLGY
jgi:hypothetical protein